MLEFFCNVSQWVLAVKYFHKNTSPYKFNWVLNTLLYSLTVNIFSLNFRIWTFHDKWLKMINLGYFQKNLIRKIFSEMSKKTHYVHIWVIHIFPQKKAPPHFITNSSLTSWQKLKRTESSDRQKSFCRNKGMSMGSPTNYR